MNTKALESVIVVAVHVAHQKVKDGEVHQVQQTPTLEIKKIVSVKVQEFIIILLLMITVTNEGLMICQDLSLILIIAVNVQYYMMLT